MPIPYLLMGALGLGAALLLKSEADNQQPAADDEKLWEEEKEKVSTAMAIDIGTEDGSETVSETEKDGAVSPYRENQTVSEPNALRRGDRFTCPDTGQELQVRAVGGRGRKAVH
ncbi:MAG: hypothetical protein MRY32_02775 [Rickettsiales bacterium]|nr:hypothetical protein [Rickettsiales bacterium]